MYTLVMDPATPKISFRCAILQYTHPRTQEIANVGSVLWAPRTGIFLWKLVEDTKRLELFFLGFDAEHFRLQIRIMQDSFRELEALEPYSDAKLTDILGKVTIPCGLCLGWSDMASGLDGDLEKRFQALNEEYLGLR
jgi:hypothetical protein